MNTLVDVLASKFVRLSVTERRESFSRLAGASPCRPLLILAVMTIRVAEHSYETVA